MVKISIISGFLGAGKTSFIQRLLAEDTSSLRFALIENEFGSVNLDSAFIQKTKLLDVCELQSGCICCTLTGSFKDSLRELLRRYELDHCLIEPSGVAKLSDIRKAVHELQEEGFLISLHALTLVDVSKARMYEENFGEFFRDQLEHADGVLFTRCDLYPDAYEETAAFLRSTGITVPMAALSEIPSVFPYLNALHAHHGEEHPHEEMHCHNEGHHHEEHHHEEDHHEEHHHDEDHHEEHGHHHEHEHDHEHHHEHGEHCGCADCSSHHHESPAKKKKGFYTKTWKPQREYTEKELLQICSDPKYSWLRAKGFVPTREGYMELQYVPGELILRPTDRTESILVFIGPGEEPGIES